MVIDYRHLNSQTIKDKFPLPCIDDLLERLSGFNLFCILDACQGFNQIPMDEESSRKAAFTTPDGDLLWSGVSCFVDDIFFGSTDFDDMIANLRQVLEKLLNAEVTLKLSKCEFGMSEIEYLDQKEAFEELRSKLISRPALKLFYPKDETELHTDASSVGLAGMLLQRNKYNNAFQLVYCVSRRTTQEEEKYHSSRLELIAAVWSMTRLRPLLLGLHFTLVTDCSAITYLHTQKNIKPQIARWTELLSEFDYVVKHRDGAKMAHVDALSRSPIEERTYTLLDKIEVTSPVELTSQPKVFYISTEEDRVALIQAQDKDLQKIISSLKKPQKLRTLEEKQSAESFDLIDGILYRIHHESGDLQNMRKLFVMPKSMRKYLAVRFHDFAGHFGMEKVVQMIRKQFWFPRKWNSISPGSRPFEVIHMDFLGPFVTSTSRNTELLVFIDNMTKFVRLRPCSSCSTKNVLKYLDEFTNDFGCPRRIVTDRGSCFSSSLFEDYCKQFGIKHTLNSSQRPQANGQVERINRILIPMISSSVQTESHKDWDKILPQVQRCINWSPSKSTGKPPFELLYGYTSVKLGYFPQDLLPTSNEYVKPTELQRGAQENIRVAQEKMKKNYDKHRCRAQNYNIGDVVVVRRLPEQTLLPNSEVL
ncbi:Transposon Ty3-I Gag-Pol polyprotein like [Argiope bruennichi]|uniref:RNA-directed DNA polymerase n=1 Tax=Argiope bruennichi TaxID=94029 RepID=A0A8T0FUH7_ARGBR|nr:Transposon Ty3-I Gag-Pol polyprotein like [Argiope bruennichi]